MSTPASQPHKYTLADWLAQPEDARMELIDGELIQKAAPSFEHGAVQLSVGSILRGAFQRKGGPGGLGGWWFGSEVDIALDGRGYRPDLAGWRRERLTEIPKKRPVEVRPDWICEILSDSNRNVDLIKKVRRYHEAGVPHYWVVDPIERSLTVYRNGQEGYLVALAAEAGEKVRAEPFDALEIAVAELLGDDPEE